MAARDGGGKGPAPDGGPVLRLGNFLNRGLRGLVRRRPGGGTARFDPSGTVRFDGGEEGGRSRRRRYCDRGRGGQASPALRSTLHFMRADNRHLRNALLEMFGNEEMSDVLITKLEYRCSTKSYVDVGSIVGGSTAGSVMAMLLLVVFLLVVKRKVRDETRAVMLLGKSEEEKNKLLDEWGIGYKAKRAKEIAKATKAHKKELKRKENELKAAQKAAAKRKRKHDRLVEKVNKKHQKKGLLSIGGKR